MASSDALALLESSSQGFRTRYLPYDDLTRQVKAWAGAFPEVVQLTSLGRTRQGRDVWLLTIGRDPDRARPAAWIDANIHASELCGSSVALAIAEDMIRSHVAPGAPLRDLPSHLAALLRDDVLFHVLPRLCPDGADLVLGTGQWVRSNPRDDRLGRTAPYWRAGDVDGDGRVQMMRREDPAGNFVASRDVPNLMLPRRIDDDGPYYALYTEGTIENFDGTVVPPFDYLSDNATDMNRNFPFNWAPEPHQPGAGDFATSEPEARFVSEFAARHPNVFAWLSLHTYGGCYIRPHGERPDKQMDQSDLALFRQLGVWSEAITGYPMVSGFEEFTYEPDKPLCGDLSSFAYAQRGAVAMVCELWDFWKQVGLSVHRPFVFNYSRRTREDIVAMAKWDREHNRGRIVGSWRPFDHPQLGRVDLGGYDPRFGIWNPPHERIADVCDAQARMFLRIAALAPRLRLRDVVATRLGDALTRVSAVVENIGYLPTYILSSARALPFNDPVRARIEVQGQSERVAGDAEQPIGHLGGWGSFERGETPSLARTETEPARKRVEWVVKGSGAVTIRVGCARVGHVERTLELG